MTTTSAPVTFFKRSSRSLEAHPEAAGAFVRGEFIDAAGEVRAPWRLRAQMISREELGLADGGRSGPFRRLTRCSSRTPVVPMGTLLVRRDSVPGHGRLRPDLRGRQDWEFTIRLARQAPLIVVDRALVSYRRHSGNASANRVRDVRTARRVLGYGVLLARTTKTPPSLPRYGGGTSDAPPVEKSRRGARWWERGAWSPASVVSSMDWRTGCFSGPSGVGWDPCPVSADRPVDNQSCAGTGRKRALIVGQRSSPTQ